MSVTESRVKSIDDRHVRAQGRYSELSLRIYYDLVEIVKGSG
jgi:hypothetical protein